MKAILRKGMAACAAMLMGANVMAQGLEYATTMAEFICPESIRQPAVRSPRAKVEQAP